MAKGIEIDIAANTRDFQRGTKDVEKALEDVADALDDVSKDAKKAGDKLGDELSDGAKDATRGVDKLERSFKDVADASKRETRSAGDSMKRNMKDGADGASDAVREWGDEAKQNVSETFSSFDGSAESFADMVQGTFGGVISNLGPLGMVAGAAGAAGIGLLMKAFEDGKVSEEEFRARVAELADVLIETGGEGADALQAMADRMRDLVAPTDEGAMSLSKIRAMADDSGASFEELAKAYGHAGGDLQAYIDEVDKSEAATRDQLTGIDALNKGEWGRSAALGEVSDHLRELAKEQEAAKQAEQDWIESGGAALEARAAQMETLQGELDEAIDSWDDYKVAETGAADPAAYIAAMQARMDATSNFNTNVQELAANTGLSFEETQAILEQGVDFAPMLAAIMSGGPEMQAQYAGQIRAMLDGGQSIIDGTETTATITTKTDSEVAEQQLDAAATERQAPVKAEADTKAAATQLDSVATKQRTATIVASVDTSAAAAALDRFINRQRTATITAEVRTREGVLVP